MTCTPPFHGTECAQDPPIALIRFCSNGHEIDLAWSTGRGGHDQAGVRLDDSRTPIVAEHIVDPQVGRAHQTRGRSLVLSDALDDEEEELEENIIMPTIRWEKFKM